MSILSHRAARASARHPEISAVLPDPVPRDSARSRGMRALFARSALAAGVILPLVTAAAPAMAAADADEEMARFEREVRSLPVFDMVRADLEARGFDVVSPDQLAAWRDGAARLPGDAGEAGGPDPEPLVTGSCPGSGDCGQERVPGY